MNKSRKYIILAAGGTGGHMMPAEAIADKLFEAGYDLTLITDRRGKAIGNVFQSIDSLTLDASSHMGGGIMTKLRSLWSVFTSSLQVCRAFKNRRPVVVVGFGGYPSLPAVLAARMMGIPYVLHEQNAVLGRVNRRMAKGAELVALSLENTQKVPSGTKTKVVGNPVRTSIAKLNNIAYAVPLGVGDIRILVVGGSQGARILSDIVPTAIAELKSDFRDRIDVRHQARAEDVERVREAYKAAGIRAVVQPYFDDIGGILLKSQLVIARSGASTLAELTAMGRPAILVPLAIAADNHQEANADLVEKAGAGWVLTEREFTVEALRWRLDKVFSDMGALSDASDAHENFGTTGFGRFTR